MSALLNSLGIQNTGAYTELVFEESLAQVNFQISSGNFLRVVSGLGQGSTQQFVSRLRGMSRKVSLGTINYWPIRSPIDSRPVQLGTHAGSC